MKSLLPLIALVAVSTASANGGLSIDTAKQSINQQTQENAVAVEIVTQAPVDKFDAYMSDSQSVVDTDSLRHNFDGQS